MTVVELDIGILKKHARYYYEAKLSLGKIDKAMCDVCKN